ncbi:MAG: tetratricopeptide repeat protein [Terriglobales bacterium]|jgi:tol-pal system protein YbgF
MKKSLIFTFVVLLALGTSLPAFAANKDMIQLQTQVQALQEQMARMQQSFDERMGVMRNLVEQTTDNINKMSVSVDNLNKSLQQQNADAAGRLDQVSGQVQSLHDSVDELKARMNNVSKQLSDMAASQQNLNPNGNAGQAPPPGGAANIQAPPADILYNNALRDYNAAKYQLAQQEFADYLKFYGNTDLAGNAQFYIAEIEYRQGNYQQAVTEYDKVLEQYPGGNKAPAAQLKKGFALLESGQKDPGVKELQSLIARYPRAPEAAQAKDRLRKAGVGSTASRKPSATRQ